MVDVRRAIALTTYAAANVCMYGLLKKHYHDACSSSWFSMFALEPSVYCQLVRRALGILQFAPLVAAGLAVGPIADIPLI